MEVLLGLSKKTILPKEGMQLLQQAIASREEIHKEYQDKIHVEKQIIEAMQSENSRLVAKITQLNNLTETQIINKNDTEQ